MTALRPAQRRFYSLEQSATYLDVTVKTVRRWIAEGRLPAYRLGDRLLKVDIADLDAFARRVPTTGEDR